MMQYLPGKKKQGKGKTNPCKELWAEKGSWLAVLKASWQPIFQFDRSNITAFQAIRSTIGVALPLVLGVTLGRTTEGVVMASGALMLGAIGLRDPYQLRGRTMLRASLLVTLSTLIGGITGRLGWLPILAIGIWGVVAGIVASLSQAALVVGLQSCIALIVYVHLKLDPLHAVFIACLVGSGALFQTLLAMLPSPWKNTVPERTTLATIYQQLADYAAHPDGKEGALQISDALLAGHMTLLHSNTRSEQGQMLARLLEEAEHLRLTLSLLIRQRKELSEGTPEQKNAGYLDRLLRSSGDALQGLALTLKPSLPFIWPENSGSESSVSQSYIEARQALTELRHVAWDSGQQNAAQQILRHCTTLLGELAMVRKLIRWWKDARQFWPAPPRFPYPRPQHLHLEDRWSNLRANLTPRSSAFRHAIRLGGTLALTMAIYLLFQMPDIHGYWIPMTAALVLRSDFITTFTRGTARLLGTLLGAVLTTLLATLLTPSPTLFLVIFVFAVYLMHTILFANYAIFSIMVTTAIVFLLAFTKAPTSTTAAERALDTVIGGGLALLIYVLWPTWERSQMPESIAQRIEMLSYYLRSVMQAYIDPDSAQEGVLDKRHMESRLARSNALGSLQRARQEPKTRCADLDLAEDLLGASDNISRAALSLEAYLLNNPRHNTLPELANFSGSTEQALHQLAEAIREKRRARALPDLQADLQNLQGTVRREKYSQSDTWGEWQFVSEEAKRVVANILTMQQLLAASSLA